MSRPRPSLCSLARAVLLLGVIWTAPDVASADPVKSWEILSAKNGVRVARATEPGSAVYRFRGEVDVTAPPELVVRLLTDVERFHDYVPHFDSATRLEDISEIGEGASATIHQGLNLPMIADRDVVIQLRTRRDGRAWTGNFTALKGSDPAPRSGVVRIEHLEGSWRVEPGAGERGRSCRLTYTHHTDIGGHVPAWLANLGAERSLFDMLEALRAASEASAQESYQSGLRP